MRFHLTNTPLRIIGCLMIISLLFLSCSDDSDCPVCPSNEIEWVAYDNFDDNTLDTDLWNYIVDCCGGQVLEVSNQLQVWGNTEGWTGTGIVRTTQPKLAWRFELVEAYSEDTPAGCQGWHIYAYDPANNVYVEVLNDVNSGCALSYDITVYVGTIEINHEGDSLVVFRNDTLVHRVYDQGIDFFSMHFTSDNMYGDGTHSHIFMDDFWGLEWKP